MFWWGGWISLAFALFGVLAALTSFSPQTVGYDALPPGSFIYPSMIMTVVSLPSYLLLPVVMFLGWGVLTALCEIHEQVEEQTNLMREDGSAGSGTDAA